MAYWRQQPTTENNREDGLLPSLGGAMSGRALELAQVARDNERLDGGRVIVNPISGERIVIRVSGAETDGELLVFDLYLPPGGHVPAGHTHPSQEERFTVIEGLMRFRLGPLGRRRAILAHPGETIRVPAGTAHWFGNPGAQVAHAQVEVRPALRMEELFATTATIGSADAGGHGFQVALTRLTDLAHVVFEFRREVVAPHAPAFVVTTLLAPIAWLGRRRACSAEPAPGSRAHPITR